MNSIKFDFDDITLVPEVLSKITSRYRDIDLTSVKNGFFTRHHKEYRLMTAPMDTVISSKNHPTFFNAGIIPILPRNTSDIVLPSWYSLGLSGFEMMVEDKVDHPSNYILLDIANGHMLQLIELIRRFKDRFPKKKLMVGNIANPLMYKILSDAGADYVRCGVGAGSGCLSSEMTAVYYPMASLVKECRDISDRLENPAYIVADGGMRKYADIIKALNLGADYVMIGGLFNKMVESEGESYLWKTIPVSQKFAKKHYKKYKLYKRFRGMSTKEVQREWGKENVRTSEGIVKWNRVRYDLKGWLENYEHYLRSAMSYTGCSTIDQFIGQQSYIQITSNAYKRFNK